MHNEQLHRLSAANTFKTEGLEAHYPLITRSTLKIAVIAGKSGVPIELATPKSLEEVLAK